ncbi:hypothetical protein PPERSA_11841 [Pseudocohnilembus persalinus]|uniref:Uncharacterized protein n=1 Tax=Pseudocohnilembus persalinus TaxID=266149 RepID=A0A0V0QKE9_PSEPJ|nr:hypothetical protein PPERSA_11841 [Pseudocohnilembus persalinus]|eukprot:KRX02501.1 hypothetical protein PPERSA_11841 [Pseudocohnilembus persalinus]
MIIPWTSINSKNIEIYIDGMQIDMKYIKEGSENQVQTDLNQNLQSGFPDINGQIKNDQNSNNNFFNLNLNLQSEIRRYKNEIDEKLIKKFLTKIIHNLEINIKDLLINVDFPKNECIQFKLKEAYTYACNKNSQKIFIEELILGANKYEISVEVIKNLDFKLNLGNVAQYPEILEQDIPIQQGEVLQESATQIRSSSIHYTNKKYSSLRIVVYTSQVQQIIDKWGK